MLNIGECRAFYVLAAKGIQKYILSGNKLRLMVGGSELVQSVPGKFLESILGGLGLKKDQDYRIVSSAAGSARVLFKEEAQAREGAKIVPMALAEFAPGLDCVQAVVPTEDGSFADWVQKAEDQLGIRRQLLFPDYPIAGPLVERYPRSGLPVAGSFSQGPSRGEHADRSMIAKDEESEGAQSELAKRIMPASAGLVGKQSLHAKLPLDFSDISGGTGNIAIVHVDGNGLGKIIFGLLKELKQSHNSGQACDCYSEFSGAVDRATCAAMQKALEGIVAEGPGKSGCYPFRPLICAGDDVTMVLRAKDAIPFAEKFLREFETQTKAELGKIGVVSLRDRSLTACAGIVFVKDNFPFAQAYALCESLCKYAKDKTNRTTSALAFWRQTTSVADEFETILKQELTTSDGVLTMMPYALEAGSGHSSIGQLLKIKEALQEMPRGSMRGILSDLYHGRAKAKRSFERVCAVAQGRAAESQKGSAAKMKALLDSLEAVTGNVGAEALFRGEATPLHDASELIAAERE